MGRCVSCHIVQVAERQQLRARKKPFPDDVMYSWPMPDLIGLSLDPKAMARVRGVEPGSEAAEAVFTNFGASSLDFELRVWLGDAERRYAVASDLRFRIDAAFREHKIEIPFSQHDLHVRSVDDAAARKLLGIAEQPPVAPDSDPG